MQDKNNTVKIAAFLIMLALGGPIYMFLGITIEKKRKNAVANADKPWAADSLSACAWRYEWSMRKEVAMPIYAEWLKIYGGNDVNELCFPDRYEEIQEYGDDTEHKFNPPRINKEKPHKDTPYMLFNYALLREKKRDRYAAEDMVKLILDPNVFPTLDPEFKKKVDKAYLRLRQ